MTLCVKLKRSLKLKKNFNFKKLKTIEIVKNLQKSMDNMYNNRHEWQKQIDINVRA